MKRLFCITDWAQALTTNPHANTRTLKSTTQRTHTKQASILFHPHTNQRPAATARMIAQEQLASRARQPRPTYLERFGEGCGAFWADVVLFKVQLRQGVVVLQATSKEEGREARLPGGYYSGERGCKLGMVIIMPSTSHLSQHTSSNH